jgi:predicted RNase H-like nuclease
MPLDKVALSTALKAAFQKGAEIEGWTAANAADEIAAAIDDYIRDAEVIDVAVDVSDLSANPIGTGVQSAPGKLN